MSYSKVDEQVVKMSFDNSNFDSNIDSSIKYLNKLDNRISTLNNTNSIATLTSNFNELKEALNIKNLLKIGAFTKLGGEIVELGKKIKNSLVKGFKDGWHEYQLLIDSTQTIYENVKQSGKTIDDVNQSLDELNEYADKTVYNFSEMTRMIGMFTSAGVGLNSSVKTIKGLANAAALVGANSQKAEMAWRAVSRAMSTGKFTALTWKSLEQSNIAGKQFQTVIKEVAKTMKKVPIDKYIKKYGSLRESLKKGWLTKDLFAEAMKIMSGDMTKAELKAKGYSDKQIKQLLRIAESAQEAATRVKTFRQLMETTSEAVGSGWAQSFRILVGDLDQARKLYTRISETINDFIDNNANIRNELFTKIMDYQSKDAIGSWKSGRDNLTQSLENIMATIKTFLKSIKTGFLNVFPVDRLAAGARKVLDIVQKFTRVFVLNAGKVDKSGKMLWNTSDIDKVTDAVKDLIKFFRGLAAVIDIAWMAISQPIAAVMKHIPFFKNFFDNMHNNIVGFIGQLGKFGDKIELVREAAKEFNIFGAAVDYVIDNFDEIARNNPIIQSLVNVFDMLKNAILNAKDSFDKMEIKPLTTLFGIFKMVVNGLLGALNGVASFLSNASSKIDWSWLEGPKKIIGEILKTFDDYGKGLISFEEATSKIGSFFKDIWSSLFGTISSIPFGEIFGTAFDGLQKAFSKITKIVTGLFGSFNSKVGGSEKIVTVVDKADQAFSGINITLDKTDKTVSNLSNAIDEVGLGVKKLTSPVKALGDSTTRTIDNIDDILEGGSGEITKTIDGIGNDIKDEITDSIDEIADVTQDQLKDSFLGRISGFFQNIFGNIGNSIGDVAKKLAMLGGGIGVATLGISHFIKTFKKIQIFDSINSVIGAGVDVIKAYERQLNTKAILNIAIALGILATVMVAFAFIPYEKIETGLAVFTAFLSVVALTVPPVILALAKLKEAIAKVNASKIQPAAVRVPLTNVEAMSNVLNNLIISTKEFGLKMAKGLNARLIGKAFKDIAIAVLILVGAMIALKYTMSVDEMKEYGLAIANIIGAVAVVLEVLLITIKAFEVASKNLSNSVATFSGFFTLAGVASVILAIAAATAVLSASLIMLSKADPNALKGVMAIYREIFWSLAVVMIAITALSRNAGAAGKLKKITLSITGALLGLAAVFAVLTQVKDWTVIAAATAGMTAIFVALTAMMIVIGNITIPDNIGKLTALVITLGAVLLAVAGALAIVGYAFGDNTEKWKGTLISLGGLFMIMTGMLIPLLEVAKHVGHDLGVWTSLQVSMIVMANSMLAVAGALYIMKDIKPTQLLMAAATFAALFVTFSSMVAFAYFLTTAGGVFSESFTRTLVFMGAVITSVAMSIAVVVFALTQLVNAFNNINTSTESIGEQSQNITDRLAAAGAMVLAALPQIVDLFTKIGMAAGSVFIAFTTSFVNKVAEMGDQYAQMADRIVNVILDIAGKVIDSLYARKDELSIIVVKALKVVSQVITDAINMVFNGEDAEPVKQTTVARWLGLGTMVILIGRFATSVVSILKGLGTVVKTVAVGIKNAVVGVCTALKISYAEFAVIVAAIIAAYAAAKSAYHGLRQLSGKEEAYHNASINSGVKALEALFTDAQFRMQSMIYGMAKLGRIIIQVFMTIIRTVVGIVSRAVYYVLATITQPFQWILDFLSLFGVKTEGLSKNISDFVTSFKDVSDNSFKDIVKGWKEIDDFEFGKNEWKEKAENVREGVKEGLSGLDDDVTKAVHDADMQGIKTAKSELGIASPSKVAEKIYSQVPAGALRGLKKGSKSVLQFLREQNIEMVNTMRNMNVSGISANGQEYNVELNRQLLELTEKQAEAIKGKSKEEVYAYLTEQATIHGIMDAKTEAAKLTAVYFAQQQDQTKLQLASIQAVTDATTYSLEKVVGEKTAADYLVLNSAIQNNQEMMNLAADHATELVGLDKKAAQAKLKEWAIERGMEEQDAEQSSKKMVALIFAQQKNKKKLTKAGIEAGIKLGESELQGYKALLQAEEKALQDSLNKKAKMQEAAYKEMADGKIDTATLRSKLEAANKVEQDAVKKYRENIKKIGFDDGGMLSDGYFNKKQYESEYQKALNAINTKKSNQRGSSFKNALSSFVDKVKNGVSNALNLDSWKNSFNNNKDNNNNKNDNDKDAVKAAKDTKKKLESNRADLTPTFDLDKLASEANKANGIVMSSLMAAQNASIGDYINKDSELNPFMKDRWQNVYNFTQNNYSPKALSRIDIYRQTQRQLSMSRGF